MNITIVLENRLTGEFDTRSVYYPGFLDQFSENWLKDNYKIYEHERLVSFEVGKPTGSLIQSVLRLIVGTAK